MLQKRAGLVSQKQMVSAGVTRVHSASFVSASQPRRSETAGSRNRGHDRSSTTFPFISGLYKANPS